MISDVRPKGKKTISVRKDLLKAVDVKQDEVIVVEERGGVPGDDMSQRWKRVIDYAAINKLWDECQPTQLDPDKTHCKENKVKQEQMVVDVEAIDNEIEVVFESDSVSKREAGVSSKAKRGRRQRCTRNRWKIFLIFFSYL